MTALRWVLFDLNGTLVDPAVLAQPLGDSAADEELAYEALDDANREATVLTLGGARATFADLLAGALRRRLALAGRDPEAYENPHKVDIDRPVRHIAFGTGPVLRTQVVGTLL